MSWVMGHRLERCLREPFSYLFGDRQSAGVGEPEAVTVKEE